MNTIEFLGKLGTLYTTEDENKSIWKERISTYADLLDNEMSKEKNREPDYQKTFNYIARNYPYRTFPTFNYIMENMQYTKINIPPSKRIKYRGFKVQTDRGVYDFWGYIPADEKVEYVRGFKVIEEIDTD